ncbi:hypothetical protein PENSPDRAFT_735234 [Peniophora sp. CONT]|nr:hypothetical protein PENSPDRAFT_735234 [Peniophora sp. CONT]
MVPDVDRSTILNGLECKVCASGLARTRIPQSNSNTQPTPKTGQIRKIHASALAPLGNMLGVKVGDGRPGRPCVVCKVVDADNGVVELLATFKDSHGVPKYKTLPDLQKFFVVRISTVLGDVAAENTWWDEFHLHTFPEWDADGDQYIVAILYGAALGDSPFWTQTAEQGVEARVEVEAAEMFRLMEFSARLESAWAKATQRSPERCNPMIAEFKAHVARTSKSSGHSKSGGETPKASRRMTPVTSKESNPLSSVNVPAEDADGFILVVKKKKSRRAYK